MSADAARRLPDLITSLPDMVNITDGSTLSHFQQLTALPSVIRKFTNPAASGSVDSRAAPIYGELTHFQFIGLADKLGLYDGSLLVEAGCGLGKPSLAAAVAYGCNVVGIEVVLDRWFQAEHKRRELVNKGFSDLKKVSFLCGDLRAAVAGGIIETTCWCRSGITGDV